MKKITLLLSLAFIATTVFAQDLTSKKGETYLPEAGDWALSIDGSSFLRYAGNFIGGNGLNAAPTFNFLSTNQTIIGKYFIDPSTAYRVGVCIGMTSNSKTDIVTAIPYTTPTTYVDDVEKVSSTNIGLTFGKEWRKGKTRLQGLYGVEAGVAINSSSIKDTYGNALSASNYGNRPLETKSGSTFQLGLRGFIGAEYFIFPKIAIGGEFGWGLAFSTTGKGSSTGEYWSNNQRNTSTYETGGSSSFGIDSDKLNSIFGSAGTIRLTLHF